MSLATNEMIDAGVNVALHRGCDPAKAREAVTAIVEAALATGDDALRRVLAAVERDWRAKGESATTHVGKADVLLYLLHKHPVNVPSFLVCTVRDAEVEAMQAAYTAAIKGDGATFGEAFRAAGDWLIRNRLRALQAATQQVPA